jgi:serine/threonine protein phosphatase PrpC
MYQASSYLEQQNTHGEDALELIEQHGCIWFCISDGAGGIAGGSKASEYVVTVFERFSGAQAPKDPLYFESFLRRLDVELLSQLDCGEATAIIGMMQDGVLVGASVGDSEAWYYGPDFEYQLTSMQNRKPLLGSGASQPIGFGPTIMDGILLLGSDGLFKYANHRELNAIVRLKSSAEEIAALAKVETGKLQDDISAILIRKLP